MSKEKPEVGDVWEYQGKLYHISSVTDRIVEVWCKSSDDIMRKHNWVYRGFVMVFKYLGKSKVSIKELFDVVDTVNDTVNDIVKDRSDNETN